MDTVCLEAKDLEVTPCSLSLSSSWTAESSLSPLNALSSVLAGSLLPFLSSWTPFSKEPLAVSLKNANQPSPKALVPSFSLYQKQVQNPLKSILL